MDNQRIRILVAKIGLDGHDRGVKVVARALRNAGMEVIYTGIRQSIPMVVNASVQEDVDVLGISFLSGDHLALVPKVMQQLATAGRPDLPVIVGGIILKPHIPVLLNLGVRKVFLPGTLLKEIITYIEHIMDEG
jgi:methylmalonyl-CoA mutase, C-terminal domain